MRTWKISSVLRIKEDQNSKICTSQHKYKIKNACFLRFMLRELIKIVGGRQRGYVFVLALAILSPLP